MWIITPPSSTIRRASAAYSAGVEGVAGRAHRLAAHGCRSDADARVVADALDLGRLRLGAHEQPALGVEAEPHRCGHRLARALVRHEQAVLVPAQGVEALRRRLAAR